MVGRARRCAMGLLVVAGFVLGGKDSAAGDLCAWRFGSDPSETVLNGVYTEQPNGGFPYYEKAVPQTDEGACGVEFLYVYMQASQWRIGPTLGGFDYIALCNSDFYVASPTDCVGDWTLAVSGNDGDATVIDGACPRWDCPMIEITYPSSGRACEADYVQVPGTDNAWTGHSAALDDDVYFYFDPLLFRWQCGAEVDADCSAVTYDVAAAGDFTDLALGETQQIAGQTSGETFTAACVGAATTTTTTPVATTSTVTSTSTITTTMSSVTTTSTVTTTTTLVEPSLCGDPVDPGSGSIAPSLVTATDALLALRAAVGTASCVLCLCDVNSSGAVTAIDALAILIAASGQPVTLECPPCS